MKSAKAVMPVRGMTAFAGLRWLKESHILFLVRIKTEIFIQF